jgi:phosphoribosylamine--glycine ligase
MKVLIIGSGGREHALAWKLAQSKTVEYLGSGLRTSGGRVLAVSAAGDDANDARAKAYQALRFVNFEGMVYRTDIGNETPPEV